MNEQLFFENYSNQSDSNREAYFLYFKNYIKSLHSLIPEIPFSNIWAASKLSNKLPVNSTLHFGILNSLRSWNFFEVDKTIVTACNVGGFGIDGNLSSIIGASFRNSKKLYFLVLGDLAFFYDMNSLGNINVSNNLRILLINNGKGTEFRHFNHNAAPLEEKADDFVAAAGHFGNKSKTLVKSYVESLGLQYLAASNKEEFEANYETFINSKITDNSIVFELFTDSKDESDALEKIITIKKSNSGEFKKMVKQVLGKKSINSIKSFLK
jgi:2-succinyl-5-enolpyruvyl-6-hydroxy-3-cyclohexene-1-carboxylate synthase